MIRRICLVVVTLAGMLFLTSCSTPVCLAPKYSYSATIWQSASTTGQLLLTIEGTVDKTSPLLGHYFGEPVSIIVEQLPSNSVTIGAFSIASPTVKKCFPIKTWTDNGKTMYGICDHQAADQHGIVFIGTDSKVLTEPLLKELIEKFTH
jgi:hypothetical protein